MNRNVRNEEHMVDYIKSTFHMTPRLNAPWEKFNLTVSPLLFFLPSESLFLKCLFSNILLRHYVSKSYSQLGIYPQNKILIQNDISTQLRTGTFSTIARLWNQARCPTKDNCIMNVWCGVYTQLNILQSRRRKQCSEIWASTS